jgi:hypothetical protein
MFLPKKSAQGAFRLAAPREARRRELNTESNRQALQGPRASIRPVGKAWFILDGYFVPANG